MVDQLLSAFGNRMIINPYRYGGGGSDLLNNNFSYWDMDETSGNGVDSRGSNTLIDNNTVTSGTGVGGTGTARQFDRTNNEYFNVAAGHGLHAGDRDFAYVTWVYYTGVLAPTTLSFVAGVEDDGFTAGGSDWSLFFRQANASFRFMVSDGSTLYFVDETTIGAPVAATWYMLMVDYNSATNTMRITGNDGSGHTTSSVPAPNNGGEPFQMAFPAAGGNYWNGRQARSAFWAGYIPTPGDRTWLFNGGNGRSYSELLSYSP